MRNKKVALFMKKSISVLALAVMIILPIRSFQTSPEEIFKAAAEGDLSKAKALVEQNPELVKAKDKENETPLHKAAAAGHRDVAEYLLSKGAAVDARNNANQSPLLHASYYGKALVVELLLNAGADHEQPDVYGRTVLHYPVREGHKDVVEILVEKGMSITVEDGMSVTPLQFAIEREHIEIMKIFIASGALDVDSDTGRTALHLAAALGKKAIVDMLIASGANTRTKDDTDATLLHNAATGNLRDLTGQLLKQGIDVNAQDARGRTPLHYAVKQGSLDIVKVLIESGVDLNVRGKDGRTALHIADDWNYSEISEWLSDKGAADVPKLAPENPGEPWVGVTYISNDGFLITSKTKNVLVDSLIKNPYGYSNTPDKIFENMVNAIPPFDRIDLLLFSHAHRDHFEPEMAARIMMSHPETILVGNEVVYKELKEAVGDSFSKISRRVKNINPGWGTIVDKTIAGVNLKIFPVNHGMPDRPYVTLAFILDLDGTRVLHMGDIYAPSNEEYFRAFQLQKLDIDAAFIDPFFLLDETGRQMAKEFIQPKQIIPMHMRENEIDKYADALANFYDNVHVFKECMEKKYFEGR